MTTFTGKDGAVTFASGVIAEITEFTVNVTQNQIDANSMSNPDWDKSVGQRKAWTAEISLLIDPADTAGQGTLQVGDEGAWVFFEAGDTTGKRSRNGNGRIEAMSDAVAHDAMVSQTVTIRGNGALTEPTTIA